MLITQLNAGSGAKFMRLPAKTALAYRLSEALFVCGPIWNPDIPVLSFFVSAWEYELITCAVTHQSRERMKKATKERV
jgi:hypothetical protein